MAPHGARLPGANCAGSVARRGYNSIASMSFSGTSSSSMSLRALAVEEEIRHAVAAAQDRHARKANPLPLGTRTNRTLGVLRKRSLGVLARCLENVVMREEHAEPASAPEVKVLDTLPLMLLDRPRP